MNQGKNIPWGGQEQLTGQGAPPQPGVVIVRELISRQYIEDTAITDEAVGTPLAKEYQIDHRCMGFKILHYGPIEGPAIDLQWGWVGASAINGRIVPHQVETFDLQSLKGWFNTPGKDAVALWVQMDSRPLPTGATYGTQFYKIWAW